MYPLKVLITIGVFFSCCLRINEWEVCIDGLRDAVTRPFFVWS